MPNKPKPAPTIQSPIVEAAPDGGLRLVLPLPPLGNRAYRRYGHSIVLSGEARAYKAQIAELAGGVLIEGPVMVFFDVYRARKAGDLDGFLKIGLDSIQGVVFANDKQIVGINARRFDDRANPRIEVVVAPCGGGAK